MSKSGFEAFILKAIFENLKERKNPEKESTKEEYAPVVKAMKEQDIEKFVEEIKNNPACIKQKDTRGATPLHYAIVEEELTYAKHLINSKADVNAEDNRSSTPLDVAVMGENKRAVKCLIENGASPNIKTGDNMNAFDFAFLLRNKEIFKLLNDASLKENENLKAQLESSKKELAMANEQLEEAKCRLQKFLSPNFDIIHEAAPKIEMAGSESPVSSDVIDNIQ